MISLRSALASVALRRAAAGVCFVASMAASLALVQSAAALAPLQTGFSEPIYTAPDPAVSAPLFDQTVQAEAEVARINIAWASVAPNKPANPTNPADPAYDFSRIDTAIRAASARGLTVLLTVYVAPRWAEGANPPPAIDQGTWKPDPKAFGDFARAVGARYSGGFNPGTGTLPRVRYFEAWNEPNLSQYLTPQYKGERLVGAELYRKLLNAFYAGVKATNKSAQVLAGATAPYGNDPPDAFRTRPLRFLRETLCLRGDLRHLQPKACPAKPKFDILSHHPITLSGGPHKSAISPYDAALPDFQNVAALLRTAESKGTLGTRGHHPLWATELWWETKPPDSRFGIPLQRHARWVEEAFYLLWKQGARVVIWLQLVDTEIDNDGYSGYQTGLFSFSGERKPAYTAFRFPFVAERQSGGGVRVWTIPPSSGQLQIQRKVGNDWRTISRAKVRDGRVFVRTLQLSGSVSLRGVIAGDESLGWTEGGSSPSTKQARSGRGAGLPPGANAPPELSPYVEAP